MFNADLRGVHYDFLKTRFGLDLDVRNVYFTRKYGRKNRDDLFGIFVFDRTDDSALHYEYRGVSLLEAALDNFAPEEAREAPCNDCQVITRWNAYDGDVIATVDAVMSMALPIAPHDFAGLCRSLDLGARYQQHLKAILQPALQAGGCQPYATAQMDLSVGLRLARVAHRFVRFAPASGIRT
ncbi:hypothetical protein BFL40_01945 [Pseudomonas costantinii]|uniref:Dermonecrotic toxin N-terminal domain-containing protein n=1 Tax=Pseudomonas costantinii TaxID=168469 RepID=A0A1S2V8N4_9PSED|nr:hypothetical protein BFL40_01945 [Pseudomonas costantinii]